MGHGGGILVERTVAAEQRRAAAPRPRGGGPPARYSTAREGAPNHPPCRAPGAPRDDPRRVRARRRRPGVCARRPPGRLERRSCRGAVPGGPDPRLRGLRPPDAGAVARGPGDPEGGPHPPVRPRDRARRQPLLLRTRPGATRCGGVSVRGGRRDGGVRLRASPRAALPRERAAARGARRARRQPAPLLPRAREPRRRLGRRTLRVARAHGRRGDAPRACLSVAHRAPAWTMPARHYVVDRAAPDRGGGHERGRRRLRRAHPRRRGRVRAERDRGVRRRPLLLPRRPPPARGGARLRPGARRRRTPRGWRGSLAAAEGRAVAFLAGHVHTLEHLALGPLDVFISGSTAMAGPMRLRWRVPAAAQARFVTTAPGFAILEADREGWWVRPFFPERSDVAGRPGAASRGALSRMPVRRARRDDRARLRAARRAALPREPGAARGAHRARRAPRFPSTSRP